MKTNRKHAIAIIIAIIVVVVILVSGIILISYWNTPISKAESRTMQAIALQEDGSAEPCTVLISGISYHYLFRNHADSFEANDPGGVFVNGSRIMDSLILPSTRIGCSGRTICSGATRPGSSSLCCCTAMRTAGLQRPARRCS